MSQVTKEPISNALDDTPGAPPPPALENAATSGTPPTTSPNVTIKKSNASRIRLGVLVIILLIGSWLGLGYLRYSAQFLATEDSFINAHQVQIGAAVSGQIQSVPWQNNERVTQGEVLFTLDPTPYQVAVNAAKAALSAAMREQDAATAAIATAEAGVQQRSAQAQLAAEQLHRLLNINNKQFVSEQDLSNAKSAVAVADAAVSEARAALAQAKASAGTPGAQNDRIQSAEALLASAQYNLSKTKIVAPMTGRLANYTIEPGQPVNANQPLFSMVASQHLWVDANFKETDLAQIKLGAPAEIKSDVYGKRIFKGKVTSIAAGAGTAFSLLPPQNATGNWVKVTQRVPVRITLDDVDTRHFLPIGTSANTRILLTPQPKTFWQSVLGVIGLGGSQNQSKDATRAPSTHHS
jgi:membrane fusion protein (multidrug efflux system)